jgi:hypothetical protein
MRVEWRGGCVDGRAGSLERESGSLCQTVSPNDEPCDNPATVHCATCRRWFCDSHAEERSGTRALWLPVTRAVRHSQSLFSSSVSSGPLPLRPADSLKEPSHARNHDEQKIPNQMGKIRIL